VVAFVSLDKVHNGRRHVAQLQIAATAQLVRDVF